MGFDAVQANTTPLAAARGRPRPCSQRTAGFDPTARNNDTRISLEMLAGAGCTARAADPAGRARSALSLRGERRGGEKGVAGAVAISDVVLPERTGANGKGPPRFSLAEGDCGPSPAPPGTRRLMTKVGRAAARAAVTLP
ncbi:hypothetical protein GCM10010404_84200 [Nonomuraea africana]